MAENINDPTVPLRLRVLRSLTATLETINPETLNGDGSQRYTSGLDLRGKVFRGRNKLSANDPVPSLAILESPQQVDISSQRPEADKSYDAWEILIKGDVVDDKRHPTDPCHILMADVKTALNYERKRLTDPNPQFGSSNILGMQGAVTEMNVSPGIVRPSEENISPFAFFWLVITLRIVEDRTNPYRMIQPD